MLPLFYEYVVKDVHLLTYNHGDNCQEIINDILVIHRYLLPVKTKINNEEKQDRIKIS